MMDVTKFRPLGSRLLVRRLKPEEASKGGIIIPDTAKEVSRQGEVLAVGPGRMRDDGTIEPMPVAVGDRVLFGRQPDAHYLPAGEHGEYLVLYAGDILGVVTPEEQAS